MYRIDCYSITCRITLPIWAGLWCAVGLLCFAPGVANAQRPATLCLLSETDGQWGPVSEAEVVFIATQPTDNERTERVFTTANGQAVAPFSGPVRYHIAQLGFVPVQGTIQPGNSPDTVRLVGNGIRTGEVVVTAQMAPTLAERSTFSVRVIDRQRIEQQGAVNLADLLANEMNIRLQRDNVLGTAMTMQGLGGQNVKIMIDGVPVVGRQNGNLDLGQINLNDIERIEIIEGPMSVSFGTDALGGVINLITRRNGRVGWGGGAQGYYETAGHTNADGFVSYRKGRTQLRLSGGRNFFEGWNPTGSVASRSFQWKPREQYLGALAAQWAVGRRITFSYRGQGFREVILNRGEARVSPTAAYAFDEYFTTLRTSHDLTTQVALPHGYSLDVLAAGSWFQRRLDTFRRDLTTLEDTRTAGATGQDTSAFTLAMSRGIVSRVMPSRKLNYLVGYELNLEWTGGDRIESQRQAQQDYAAFTSWEYKPTARWAIRPGVRGIYNTAYRAPLVPSLHLKWEPVRNTTLRASYARGFRAPALRELYLYFVDINHNLRGNPDLRAEYSHSVNASATWQRVMPKVVFRAEASGYFNDVRNLITLAVADASQQLYTYVNLGHVQTMGARAEASFRSRRLALTLGGLYAGTATPGTTAAGAPPIAWSPEGRLNADYLIPKAEIRLALFYKYTGQVVAFQVDEAGSTYRTSLAAFHTVDLTATRLFWQSRIRLTLGVKNLANVQSIASTLTGGAHSGGGATVPQGTGRSAFITLAFTY